jgi:hypothetical protein
MRPPLEQIPIALIAVAAQLVVAIVIVLAALSIAGRF